MDRLSTLSYRVLSSFGLSSNSDKSKDEASVNKVAGKYACSVLSELADAGNFDSQAVDNRSSKDDSDNASSMARELPYQRQYNCILCILKCT